MPRHRTKVIQLNRINSNFGLKLVGGSNLNVPPAVAEIQPGGAAEGSHKIGVGDLLLSIDGIDVHAYSQEAVCEALSSAPDSCQFIFQTNIYIRESVLKIINLRYMTLLKKINTVSSEQFRDGELCPASELISLSRPQEKLSSPSPSTQPFPRPSPPASLSSVNGTTTDSCTESTGSEQNLETANSSSQSKIYRPACQKLSAPAKFPSTNLEENLEIEIIAHNAKTLSAQKSDPPFLNLYGDRPGSLADLLGRDKYTQRPQLHSETDLNTDFSSHPNISHSHSWHKLNQESMRQSQTQQEIIFSPNSGSVYCESLDGSFEDDLNSVISEFSRSTSVASNASSMLSEGGGAKLEALLRKDKSISNLSLDGRFSKHLNSKLPHSEQLGRKNTHIHTTSDLGPNNTYHTDSKYGSLPPDMRKRSSQYFVYPKAKISEPDSLFPNNNIVHTVSLNPEEEMSEIKKKAWRMYNLEDFTDQEVSQILAPNTPEVKELGSLYSSFFQFTDLDVIDAFRNYLRHLKLEGESQEQDRIVEYFSKRFFECNPERIGTTDSVHVLVCSLLLLNADIHGQNLAKHMKFKDFSDNLTGLCDGKNFRTGLLRECYTSIEKKPLETGSHGLQTSISLHDSISCPPENGEAVIQIEGSMVSMKVDSSMKIIREGPLYIKNITDTESKRLTGKLRHWKLFYAQIRGPLLVLWSMADKKRLLSQTRRAYSLTHSLARPCPEYTKRNHALRVNSCQRQIILIDARDLLDMQAWVSAINLTAALHSSPPMAGPLSSSTTFSRPTIPIGPTGFEKEKQIMFLDNMIDEMETELNNYSPEVIPLEQLKHKPKSWIKDMLDYRNFIASEVHRYRVYTGCIDLNDKDNLFQQKQGQVYYMSRNLKTEFEPIIESPEETTSLKPSN